MTKEERLDSAKTQAEGKLNKAAGKATGDKKQETKGKAQDLLGKAKKKVADAKDTAEASFEDTKEKLDRKHK